MEKHSGEKRSCVERRILFCKNAPKAHGFKPPPVRTCRLGKSGMPKREHHIQFGCPFSQPSVPRFSVSQLLFYDSEDMLDFRSDRWFFMFSALDLCLGSLGILPVPGWSAVDVILDFPAVFVSDDCIITLFRADIAAVATCGFLFAMQQFGGYIHIMLVYRCDFHRMHRSRILVYTHMSLVSKVPRIPLFHEMCVRIPLFFLVFRGWRRRNDDGVHDSTFFRIRPRSVSVFTTSMKNCSWIWFLTSRLRKHLMVSLSGLWLLDST